ncbi:DUOX1, partial [Symbiodinium sp. KB8]
VSVETGSTHVFLDLSILGFSFRPGQWGRLLVPSLSPIAHPFTLVPGREGATVSLCIKVGGKFTSQLADCCQAGKPPAMCLQGPYGCPCAPAKEAQRIVFVLGGVGVTPALSLAAREQASGREVDLFWALRSEALLRPKPPLPHHMLQVWSAFPGEVLEFAKLRATARQGSWRRQLTSFAGAAGINGFAGLAG